MNNQNMLEVKFRGKSLSDGLWRVIRICPFAEETMRVVSSYDEDEIIDMGTFGQWAGLKDKDGKEIYDGDILKNDYGDTGIVRWSKNCSAFTVRCIENGRAYFLYENNFNRVEIIGNIYDNPEYLN